MNNPYLVQRATVKYPLNPLNRLAQQAPNYYMGAAEFEFGAIPASIRALHSKILDYKIDEVELAPTKSVFVFNNLSSDDLLKLSAWLVSDYEDDPRINTLEPTMMSGNYGRPQSRSINFWHDIEHHLMWSFERKIVEMLPQLITNTVHFLDAKKAKLELNSK